MADSLKLACDEEAALHSLHPSQQNRLWNAWCTLWPQSKKKKKYATTRVMRKIVQQPQSSWWYQCSHIHTTHKIPTCVGKFVFIILFESAEIGKVSSIKMIEMKMVKFSQRWNIRFLLMDGWTDAWGSPQRLTHIFGIAFTMRTNN